MTRWTDAPSNAPGNAQPHATEQCTDGRTDGLTETRSHLTSETSPFVTRAHAYRDGIGRLMSDDEIRAAADAIRADLRARAEADRSTP